MYKRFPTFLLAVFNENRSLPETLKYKGFPGGSNIKNLPAVQETCFLGWKHPLDNGMATHSNYSYLGNSKNTEAWQATVHGVTDTLGSTERITPSLSLY